VRESSEIRVLVAESQVDLNRLISTYLDGKDNIRIIESVNDGKTAYDKILELKPDIALVAIIMPVLDGLAIMEKCFTDPALTTKFIVLSSINDPLIAKESFKIGASYYMLKPIDLEVLAKRIRLISRCETNENRPVPSAIAEKESMNMHRIHGQIVRLLLNIQIPSHLNGYHYLREAALMAIYNTDYIYRVTKIIYPGLAKKFKSTGDRVERSIRNAIDRAWSSEHSMLRQVFVTKPTNTQVISWIAETVRVESGLSANRDILKIAES
jgi:two-component system response regulator (stage 0 sporulation protein A)